MRLGMNENKHCPEIFKVYPGLENKIDWLPMGSFPTPVMKLERLGFENLWIKRDDLTSNIYGGNKIRKLMFILAHVQSRNKSHIITPGGIGTNHGLATTIFAKQLGFKTTLLLFHQPVTVNVKQNLALFARHGAELLYKKTLFNAMLWYYCFCRIRYPGAYFLYPGGSNVFGTIGYVNAVFELKQQVDNGLMPMPKVIFCPLGSGGTLAGLALGLRLTGLPISLFGVQVSMSHLGPFPAVTAGTVRNLMKNTYRYLKRMGGSLPEITMGTPAILDTYLGDGYGHPTPACSKSYVLMKDRENIELDPTYTAKTFAAVLDYCQSNRKDTVLFWNTYNSVDMTSGEDSADYHRLPVQLKKYVEADTVYY